MPSLIYYDDIPQANNIPQQSQPLILQNFESIPLLIDVDHYNFDINDDYGKHKHVTLPRQAMVPTTGATEVSIYSALGALSARTELYFRNQANGTVYNITEKGIGFTYLPSGLLMKWGSSTADGYTDGAAVNRVTFSLAQPAFSAAPVIQLTTQSNQNNGLGGINNRLVQLASGGANLTALLFRVNSINMGNGAGGGLIPFSWLAIGPA